MASHICNFKPKAKGWGRVNPVCNKNIYISKDRQKHGMIGRTYNKAFAPNPAQDFKHAQCKSKNMLKMMLEKEWSWDLSEINS